jgi:predicted permease
MEVADLVLPVFAIIVSGWLAGWLGYISRSLADGLVHFAYNIAMPALLFVTIAQEPARNLLEWRFLLAFGGGSVLCFALVFLAVRAGWGRDLASSTIYGMAAAMTNTGFVALPILHAIYGQPAVLPAAIATVFVAAVMFPATVIVLESEGHGAHARSAPSVLLKQIVFNPMVLSTLIGLAWAITGFADSGPDRGLFEHLRGRARAVRAVRHRAWPVVEAMRSNLAASLVLANRFPLRGSMR